MRQPEVVINALFSAERRDIGSRFSIWAVALIVLIGTVAIAAVAG